MVALTKEGAPVRDAKEGRCQSCREGHCGMCASPICTCPDRRKHRSRPGYATVAGQGPAEATHGTRSRYRKGCRCEECTSAETSYKASYRNGSERPAPPRSLTRAPKPEAPAEVAFELVEADPPVRPPKPRRLTNAERARPLLEQLMAEGKTTWHRLAVHPTARGGAHLVTAFRKAFPRTEWEFKAVVLPEVDRSAVYVRWSGSGERLLAGVNGSRS